MRTVWGGPFRAANVVVLVGIGCLSASLLPLHAQQRDTRLIDAVKRRDDKAFAALLRAKVDVNAAQPDGATPLAWAIQLGERRMAEALLDRGANPNLALPSGATPIIVAMQYRHTVAALAVLESGADIGVRDRAGNTILHLASQAGDLKLVGALLAKHADPNARTPKSMAPPGARGGGPGRGGAIGEQTPLMLAARSDHDEVMRALVAAGADPSLKAQDGTSLLMTAAAGARLKTFKYAYELDPNVNVVTAIGNTPMHVAVAMNDRTQPEVCEVIQFLADHGAPLDELNGAGRTPIAVADSLPIDLAVDLLTKLVTERGGKPKIPSKR